MFNTIEEAIEDMRNGKMIIVIDDEDRENEGDFVMAAEAASAESINFMGRFGRGMICVPITQETAQRLELDLMVPQNSTKHDTAFTVTVDGKSSSTGISAQDRANTILDLIGPNTKPGDLKRPGHIFPLIARAGGVIQRAGHTEAAVDLARLAGLHPSGVICEIMNEDGSMARRDQLAKMAKLWNMKFVTIKDLIAFRRGHFLSTRQALEEMHVQRGSSIDFPNRYGHFKLHLFESKIGNREHHLALTKGQIDDGKPILVRVHSECLTGDIFGSQRCECGEQLATAMQQVESEGRGAIIYLRQEGRGIGLANKIKAYALQDQGLDTVEANNKLGFKDDLREYGIGAQILKSLGIKKMRLMTNNPRKIVGLEGFDLEVVERVPLEVEAQKHNLSYLKAKKEKLGHILNTIH